MTLTAKAFWVTATGCGDIREEEISAEPVENEVLVRALYSGISRGTESLVFHGQVPEREFQRMRCPFQQGEFPAPVKYGYASVGVVEQGPDDLLDRQVFCLYPHQDRYRVPATAVHVLPDGVPPQRAILAANMETALNGIWDSRVGAGDRVGIVGAGVIGAMCAWLAGKYPATDTTLIDIDPSRHSLARSLGVSFALPDDAPDELDVLIHASGSQAGLARAFELAGDEAVVVELSWYGNRRPRLALGESFHSRRLTLRSSQVGQLPLERRARWDYRRRLGRALELLTDPVMEELISGESALSDLPAIMPELTESSSRVLCHRVVYD